jgi:glutamate 5-kinase
MAGKAPVGYSSGGMVTKLAAAKIAVEAGCRMAIADGTRPHPLSALADGARATWFLADIEPRAARKLWISGSLSPAGAYRLDEGAAIALNNGKSLLPAGVTEVTGNFHRSGEELGRGLSAYSAAEARLIIGHNSREIESLLGYRGREELVHRDDLVLTRKARAPESQGPGEKETTR